MKCSIIISVYKDTEALDLILQSLSCQTHLPSQVIISEDGNSEIMSTYLLNAKKKWASLNILHLSQEDVGWRKNKALNRAIVAAQEDYLVFIDGDCIPYSTFIEGHIKNAQPKVVLCGKRFEMGPGFTEKIKSKKLSINTIEKKFLFYLPLLVKDKARHIEDGFVFKPRGIINRLLEKRGVRHIIGCNFSCHKQDFLAINGFDETFILPCEGEDVDPSWRFRAAGISLKSCRCIANIAHLYHPKRFGEKDGAINREIMRKNKEKNDYFCQNGIKKETK